MQLRQLFPEDGHGSIRLFLHAFDVVNDFVVVHLIRINHLRKKGDRERAVSQVGSQSQSDCIEVVCEGEVGMGLGGEHQIQGVFKISKNVYAKIDTGRRGGGAN